MKQEKVIRINNIKLKPDHTEAELLKAVKKALRLKNNCDIKSDIIKSRFGLGIREENNSGPQGRYTC